MRVRTLDLYEDAPQYLPCLSPYTSYVDCSVDNTLLLPSLCVRLTPATREDVWLWSFVNFFVDAQTMLASPPHNKQYSTDNRFFLFLPCVHFQHQ